MIKITLARALASLNCAAVPSHAAAVSYIVQFVKTPQFGRAFLGGIAWLAFAIGGARGASIIETVPFTILAPTAANLPPLTVDVSTPQFNPSLGTLESATTTISGTTSSALEFFNTGAGGLYDIFVEDTLTLAGIPGLFGQELTGIVPADQAVYLARNVSFWSGGPRRSG
jgi:hypothetical protein